MVSPTATLAAAKGGLMRCTVKGSTQNCLAMTRTPGRPRAASASRIRFSSVGAIEGAPEAFTLTPGPRKTGTDSFRNHRPLELGKNAHHLKQRLAGDVVVSRPCWRRNRSIFSACNPERKPTKSCRLQPADRPGHDHVEFPSSF